MMGWWNHGWGLGSWEMILIGGLMMLLFWGGLFTLLFFVIRAATGRSSTSNAGGSEDEANRILDKRYAQGEIDAEEYRQMKNDLKA
jgi:putative membrane protein